MNTDWELCVGRLDEEIALDAIKHALRALRKRHLVEEAAHGPAYIALSRPFISQVRLYR